MGNLEARRKRNTDPNAASFDRTCSVIVHGVPELNTELLTEKHQHDVTQWGFLSNKLNVLDEGCGAWSICRLPRPTHLKSITAPRLLRVTFTTPTAKNRILERWYSCKNLFPSDIKFHPDRVRNKRRRTSTPRDHPRVTITNNVDLVNGTVSQIKPVSLDVDLDRTITSDQKN